MYEFPERQSIEFGSLTPGAPPLRLAGVDDDDLPEPHLVRGID